MTTEERIKVWDIAVRIFHWSLVVLYVVSYLTGEDESDLHNYAGYGVLGLIVFRLAWGVIGPRHARFTDFIYGPSKTLEYAKSLLNRRPAHYLGHNPLGGWMIIALLVSLFITCWSGMEYIGSKGEGPLAVNSGMVISAAVANDDEDEDEGEEEGDEFWEEVHEVFANLTLLLVILHIAGVIAASLVHRENLIKAMVTGYKRPGPDG
jgi:cytochrome b